MAERLCREITLLLAEHDDRPDDPTGVRDLVRARLAISLSEGLGREADVLRHGEAGVDDRARLAAFFDDRLPGPERDRIVAARANDPASRADRARQQRCSIASRPSLSRFRPGSWPEPSTRLPLRSLPVEQGPPCNGIHPRRGWDARSSGRAWQRSWWSLR